MLITYHFPPSLAVGGKRMTSFVKHLPAYRWKPFVLTLDEKHIENRDSEIAPELDHIKIIRTGLLPSMRGCYLFMKRKLNRKHSLENAENGTLRWESKRTKISRKREGFGRKLKRHISSLLIALPDFERNWILPAIDRALKEIKKEKIDVILTSGPPHSVHIVGLVVSTMTNVHWTADFRDPWMTPFNKRFYPTSRLSNRVERWLERKIFQKADVILTTTERLNDKFNAEYGDLSKAKIKFLPNGFDEDDFKELRSLNNYDIFTISYTGSIYFGRSPEPLFQAIQELIEENKVSPDEIRVKLIGNCETIGPRLTMNVIASYGLDSVVEISGYIPYRKALKITRQSHLALLLASDQPYQIPAKVYDCMGTKTKILALTKKGATADLINSTGIGKVIAPDDIENIKDYLQYLFHNQKKTMERVEFSCNQYSRSELVKDLALELDHIVTS